MKQKNQKLAAENRIAQERLDKQKTVDDKELEELNKQLAAAKEKHLQAQAKYETQQKLLGAVRKEQTERRERIQQKKRNLENLKKQVEALGSNKKKMDADFSQKQNAVRLKGLEESNFVALEKAFKNEEATEKEETKTIQEEIERVLYSVLAYALCTHTYLTYLCGSVRHGPANPRPSPVWAH